MDYLNDSLDALYKKLLPSAIGSMLTATVASFIDVLILAYFLGPDMLAVVGLCMPVYMLLNALAMLIASGGATLTAQYIGEGNPQKANACYSVSSVLMVLTGAVLMVLGSLFTTEIARLLGASDILLEPTTEYAHVLFFFMIPIMLYTLFLFFVRVDGDPNRCLVATSVCAVVNLALDVLFVGPLGWGVKGAALATCLAYTLGMLVNATHLISRKNTLKIILKNISAMTIPVLKTGLPLSLTQFGMALTTQIFNNRIIQVGGENYVSAYSVITQLSMTAMAFYDGTGQAAQPIIAANYGAKNKARISQAIRKGIRLEIVFTVLCAILYILASKGICALFSIQEGKLLSVTNGAIRIYALAIPFTGLNTFIMYSFQSQKKTTIATTLSLISSCAMMLIALFALTAVFGPGGIWFTWVVAQALSLIVSFCFYRFYGQERMNGGDRTM